MDYDLLVIGGGINGCGIARDAAGRGLSTMLVEAQDLASATSSASTKLVHGGLRYLENFEFKLVQESLKEREILLKSAPHTVWPLRFTLPHDDNLRPYWMIRFGLFLYDALSGKKSLQPTSSVDFDEKSPLQSHYKRGLSYSDCWVEDSRLVVLNAVDAYERGASIMPHTACVHLEPIGREKGWRVVLKNMMSGDEFEVTASVVVNAAGPWVRSVLDASDLASQSEQLTPQVRLVKGSHIVLPKLYEENNAYILQQTDGRIIFTIPYEKNFTLVGTTDVPYQGDASQVAIDDNEVQYLLQAVQHSFKRPCKAEDIVWNYSGVRALLDDGEEKSSKVTRDYKVSFDRHQGAPIFSIFGGKITTYRKLAEKVVDRVATLMPDRRLMAWTAKAHLPGGDIPDGGFENYLNLQAARFSFMPKPLLRRYIRAYGTRFDAIMEGVNRMQDLGTHYGDDVYEAELLYLIRYEFSHTVDDILWRRSKLGLHIRTETLQKIESDMPRLLDVIEGDDRYYANASRY